MAFQKNRKGGSVENENEGRKCWRPETTQAVAENQARDEVQSKGGTMKMRNGNGFENILGGRICRALWLSYVD